MTIGLLLAATLGVGNPLLGTWIGDGARAAATRATMTITPAAISFGAGRRALGQTPIAAFEGGVDTLAIRTRLGDRYRFRFDDADHMCRVPGKGETGLRVVECFSRARGTA